ncbi:E motif [Dillenia turbinata]|uniref:E motif n=1 Tax=Dillenia turbinata TaxID=194707 RepID=A0AAN8ZN21_9MAGN
MREGNLNQNRPGFTHFPQLAMSFIKNNLYPEINQNGSEFNPTKYSLLLKHCLSKNYPREVLLLYTHFRRNGLYHVGLVPFALKACALLASVYSSRLLHTETIKNGVESDVYVGTSLLSAYWKSKCLTDARKVFDSMPVRNVVTWNAMLGGYLANGDLGLASLLFEQMSARSDVTWSEMIGGFARNGDMVNARVLFEKVPAQLRNVVTWTVMVDGYASNGDMEVAREVFEKMPERNNFVWSSMISGYCKKGRVKEAKEIFYQIPEPNLVNWNSLVSGYAQNGFCEEALEAFEVMQSRGFGPDEFTITSVLSACAQLGLLDMGKEVHTMINNKGIKLNLFVLNGLVDMYAKCGDLNNARLIFEEMTQRNDSCWNAIISGSAMHGQCKEALEFFHRMEASSEKPNCVTFLSVLSACAHGGFVAEGLETFAKMEKYKLTAGIQHYGCLVDLLGRAGRLKEACDLVKGMPTKPNDSVWGALLGASRIHLDTEIAEWVLNEVRKDCSDSGSGDDAHYVLLSNIYAVSDQWENAERMRRVIMNKGFKKTPGRSSLMLGSTETESSANL